MKEIVWIVLLSNCITAMLPAKKRGIRDAVIWLTGLAVLVVICAPIGQAADSLRSLPERIANLMFPSTEEIEETEVQSEKWVIRYGVKNIERGVQSLIASRFALETSQVYVEAETSMTGDGAVMVDTLCVYLTDEVVCDGSAIEQYISDQLACPCVVMRFEDMMGGNNA